MAFNPQDIAAQAIAQMPDPAQESRNRLAQIQQMEALKGVHSKNVLGQIMQRNPGADLETIAQQAQQAGVDPQLVMGLQDKAYSRRRENEQDKRSAEDREVNLALKGAELMASGGKVKNNTMYQQWKRAAQALQVPVDELPAEWGDEARAQLAEGAAKWSDMMPIPGTNSMGQKDLETNKWGNMIHPAEPKDPPAKVQEIQYLMRQGLSQGDAQNVVYNDDPATKQAAAVAALIKAQEFAQEPMTIDQINIQVDRMFNAPAEIRNNPTARRDTRGQWFIRDPRGAGWIPVNEAP